MSDEIKIVKPRIGNKLKKQIDSTLAKIKVLTRHIRNVQDNCLLLGEKLIEFGQVELGKQLIANGFIHDASKFHGIEFENLTNESPCVEETAKLKLKLAVHHHQSTNKHHPEAWAGGIKAMPDVYIAEFVCDVKARSEEFGTDLRNWVEQKATTRFGFTQKDEVYGKIMYYIDLLCGKPFEEIKQG